MTKMEKASDLDTAVEKLLWQARLLKRLARTLSEEVPLEDLPRARTRLARELQSLAMGTHSLSNLIGALKSVYGERPQTKWYQLIQRWRRFVYKRRLDDLSARHREAQINLATAREYIYPNGIGVRRHSA